MGVTIGVNNRTVVHKGSGGKSIAFPDVCLTPVGSSVVPIPYPNIAVSSDMDNGAKTVKSDGNPMGHEKSIFKKINISLHSGIVKLTTCSWFGITSFRHRETYDVFLVWELLSILPKLILHTK